MLFLCEDGWLWSLNFILFSFVRPLFWSFFLYKIEMNTFWGYVLLFLYIFYWKLLWKECVFCQLLFQESISDCKKLFIFFFFFFFFLSFFSCLFPFFLCLSYIMVLAGTSKEIMGSWVRVVVSVCWKNYVAFSVFFFQQFVYTYWSAKWIIYLFLLPLQ